MLALIVFKYYATTLAAIIPHIVSQYLKKNKLFKKNKKLPSFQIFVVNLFQFSLVVNIESKGRRWCDDGEGNVMIKWKDWMAAVNMKKLYCCGFNHLVESSASICSELKRLLALNWCLISQT